MSLKYSTIIALISWIFGTYLISIFISGEVTAKFSLKIPNKQINTLEELLDSKLKFILQQSLLGFQNEHAKPLLVEIVKRAQNDRTITTISKLMKDRKWMVDLSYGKSVVFLGENLLRRALINHIKHLKANAKFRIIGERFWGQKLLSFCLSLRLNIQLRNNINVK